MSSRRIGTRRIRGFVVGAVVLEGLWEAVWRIGAGFGVVVVGVSVLEDKVRNGKAANKEYKDRQISTYCSC